MNIKKAQKLLHILLKQDYFTFSHTISISDDRKSFNVVFVSCGVPLDNLPKWFYGYWINYTFNK